MFLLYLAPIRSSGLRCFHCGSGTDPSCADFNSMDVDTFVRECPPGFHACRLDTFLLWVQQT